MTFIEFALALAITAMVAAAIASMIAAVSSGEGSRRDNREYVVRAYSAKARLAAYVARSQAVIGTDGVDLVLWLHDGRSSGTVHASEIRWMMHDPVNDTIDVHWVQFPAGYTEVAKAIEDDEYATNADWFGVLNAYTAAGFVSKLTLLDGVEAVAISLNKPAVLDATQVTFELKFGTSVPDQVVEQNVAAALLDHNAPTDP